MSEFHDPDLRQQLGRISGPYPDDNAAFAAWQRRVGQARRRRAVGWTTGAAMSLLIATVGVAALQTPNRQSLVPADSPDTTAQTTHSIATTEVDTTAAESTVPETTAPATIAPDTTPSTAALVETSLPEVESTDGSASGSGGSGKTSKPKGAGTPAPAPAPAPVPQSATKTIGSTGGSITVRQDGDKLTITAVNPAAGFEASEDQSSGRRVSISFKSGKHTSRISAKLSNGSISADVSEKDDQGDSGDGDHPGDTTGDTSGDHGDGSRSDG